MIGGARGWKLVLIVAVLGSCDGCRKKSSDVTIIPRSTGTLLWEPLRQGVAEALRESNVHMRWENSLDDGDVENQLNAVAAATLREDRGIIFVPDETLASRSIVLDAVRHHIPVVVVDDDFGPSPGPFLSYVSSDEAAAAQLVAQRVAEDLHGRGSVAVIGINPRQEGSISREVLVEHAITQIAPGIRFVLRQWGDAAITHEQQICQQLFRSGSPPDAILALSSAATRGAYYAKIAEDRPPQTVIIGFDQDDRDMLLPIRTGDVDAVVVQNTRAIGELAARNILAQLHGQPLPGQSLVAPILVTRQNLDRSDVVSLLAAPAREQYEAKEPGAQISALREEAKKHELQPGVDPIGSFIRLPGRHPGITIQGAVISLPPMLEVQDETSAVLIPSFTSDRSLKLGDIVTVHGDLTSERFRSRIENALIQVLWSERPVAPLAVTATQLTAAYRGESIEVEGTVLSEGTADGRPELVLRDGMQTFRALLYVNSDAGRQHFPPGSRVRLRGTATALPELTHGMYPFTVVADHVQLLSAPPWWSPMHIAILALAAVGLLIAVQWLLHSLQRWNMRAVLREREQLAFEMHDTLAQSFTGVAYQLQAAHAERSGEDAVKTHVENALKMVRMSHREASQTIASLRPQHRDPPGILNALKQSAERLSASGDLVIFTSINEPSAELPIEVTEAFFRIGQEAISNAIQHGHCKTIWIDLQISRRFATMYIRDDGAGFSPLETGSSGLGVVGMRRRADAIKATFKLESTPGRGTSLTVACPLIFTSGLLYKLRGRLALNLLYRSSE
jgi:signal transduction histidine kinase/ABC-type sugar transport system substrate-binding protein